MKLLRYDHEEHVCNCTDLGGECHGVGAELADVEDRLLQRPDARPVASAPAVHAVHLHGLARHDDGWGKMTQHRQERDFGIWGAIVSAQGGKAAKGVGFWSFSHTD